MSQQLVKSAVMCHMVFVEFLFSLGKRESLKDYLESVTSEAHRRLIAGRLLGVWLSG